MRQVQPMNAKHHPERDAADKIQPQANDGEVSWNEHAEGHFPDLASSPSAEIRRFL
jgi:hypothetical protein